MQPVDNGTLSVLYSMLRQQYHQKQGEERRQLLTFMGGVLCAMGATMVYRGLKPVMKPPGAFPRNRPGMGRDGELWR